MGAQESPNPPSGLQMSTGAFTAHSSQCTKPLTTLIIKTNTDNYNII